MTSTRNGQRIKRGPRPETDRWRRVAYRAHQSGAKRRRTRVSCRLYNIWIGMHRRCKQPKWHMYERYGAKGIRVCQEWHDYAAFRKWAIEKGYGPGLTIDRIKNHRGYSPANCRWATKAEQTYNSSQVALITINGITKPSPIWAIENGLDPGLVRNRITVLGWTPERAVTTPVQTKYRNRQ